MKLRVLPIIIMLFGIAGVVLFATTPVVMTKARFVNEGANTDFTESFNVFFGGNGQVVVKGDYLGSPADDINLVDKNNWYLYAINVEPYPDIVVYLSFLGLGLAFLGIFLSIFGYNDGLRIAGALLGIIGGGLGLTGCFLLYNWNVEFQEQTPNFISIHAMTTSTDYTITYSTFGFGWFAPVISSGLIALGSVFLILTKPKK
ncbi:MAG: hypothetical protein ACTSQ3_06050 [Candidatus Heimdallarchaeota archaeon]